MRRLNKAERNDLMEVSRIAQWHRFIANQLKANTALVPNGQKLAKQYGDIATFLEGVKDNMVAQKLTQLGYPGGVNFTVNLKTGKITMPKYAPQPQPEK